MCRCIWAMIFLFFIRGYCRLVLLFLILSWTRVIAYIYIRGEWRAGFSAAVAFTLENFFSSWIYHLCHYMHISRQWFILLRCEVFAVITLMFRCLLKATVNICQTLLCNCTILWLKLLHIVACINRTALLWMPHEETLHNIVVMLLFSI